MAFTVSMTDVHWVDSDLAITGALSYLLKTMLSLNLLPIWNPISSISAVGSSIAPGNVESGQRHLSRYQHPEM